MNRSSFSAAAVLARFKGSLGAVPHALLACSLLAPSASAQVFSWDFNAGQDGWEGGYSDYSGESGFEFEFARKALPKPLDTTKSAQMLKGHNRSDDLFMFMRRKVEGLAPSTKYEAKFTVRFASQYASDLSGIGGAPGGSVTLKAGATPVKPADVNGRMNIDKGNQGGSGKDAESLGDISTPAGSSGYQSIQRATGTKPFAFTTAADGSAWLLLGTDSGFEGLTVLYFQGFDATLTKVGGTGIGARDRIPGAKLGARSGARLRADGKTLVPGRSSLGAGTSFQRL